jgi:hypothetical protein
MADRILASMGNRAARERRETRKAELDLEKTKGKLTGLMGHTDGLAELANTASEKLETLKEAKDRLDRAATPTPSPSGGTRRTPRSGGDIVSHLLMIRNQIKLYHWQTKQFSRHTATDALTAALDLSIDKFVESYMGRYGRPMVRTSIPLHNFSESAATTFVAKETKYLETELPRKIGKGDSDLLNLRDEILAELTKVSYLFTLN